MRELNGGRGPGSSAAGDGGTENDISQNCKRLSFFELWQGFFRFLSLFESDIGSLLPDEHVPTSDDILDFGR